MRSTYKKYNHAVWYRKYNGCEDTVKSFDSSDDAAREVLGLVSPISEAFNVEIGGSIYHDRLGYHYSSPVVGSSTSVYITFGLDGYHTHPNAFLNFQIAIILKVVVQEMLAG